MAYNTGNALGSKDPRDLYDNASNFDNYANGPAPMYPNRFGDQKLSIEGMNQAFNSAQSGRDTQFQQFLADSAFTFLADYGPGVTITSRSQYVIRDGIPYRIAPSTTLPYTTTGNWATEQANFSPIDSDQVLRQDLASAVGGVNLIGYKAASDQAWARALGQRFEHIGTSRVEMIDFMTDEMLADIKSGNIPTVDCYPAFVAARDSLGIDGGLIIAPGGSIGSSAEWSLTDGVGLDGTGGFCHAGATTSQNTEVVALHSGRSILSVVGANGCRVRNLSVKSYPTAMPKTGILAGRSSAASAGQHYFDNVSVFGHYTTAAIYSIASEVCVWAHTYVWLLGGTAKYCFYTSSVDDLGVGGLTSSTNIGCTLIAPHFLSFANDPDSACMFMKGRYDMGSWRVMAGYFIPFSGSYLTIDLGPRDPDGNIMLGSLDFDINGEMMAEGDPKCGVRIKSTATALQPFILRGFRLNGGRFDTKANSEGDRYGLWFDDNIIFENADVVTQPASNFPYATNRVNRKFIVGGKWCVGRDAYWTAANLSSGTTNSFGGSYAPAATSVDSTNTIKCRGSVTRAALGDLLTLPTGFWPPFDQFFTSGTTRIRVSSTTGIVTATAGDFTQIDLSVISICLSQL